MDAGRVVMVLLLLLAAQQPASAQQQPQPQQQQAPIIRTEATMPAAPGPTDNKAVSGVYVPLGQAPIAVAHALQLPCGNKFLMMEFGPTGKEGVLMLPHPSTNRNGRNVLQVYDRDQDTWTNVPIDVNAVCGGWARLSNGQVGLFAGHYGTLGSAQVEGFKSIMVFDPTSYSLTKRANLTAKRWYPTTLTLPSGEVYIPGGTKPQMKNGVWPKAAGADVYNHARDSVVRVPTNQQLHDAGLGNWYLGALVLPTGQVSLMNKNMMQVVNPYTGEALATAPPLPDPVKHQVWEFPRMGPQVNLLAPAMKPGTAVRLEFMAFGGSNVDDMLAQALRNCSHVGPNRTASEVTPCAEYSVRIGLNISADGKHTFDAGWQVEKMPGPRCIFDGILLPNGHVLLLGGQKVGLGDLTDSPSYNGGHEPYAVPWIYRPNAPAGSRFLVTGARTRIARMYHSTSILTKDGDVLVGGTSNAGFWRSSDAAAFDRTPLGVNEYRNEAYKPPYLFYSNRPRITEGPPSFAAYGSTFELGYAFDQPADITDVVLLAAGGVTHNLAIGARAQRLEFAVLRRLNATHGVLRVTAPAAPEYAPPAHYMMFLLHGDAYSAGAWLQLRKRPGQQVPVDYPQDAVLVRELSASFEHGAPQPYSLLLPSSGGRNATAKFAAPAARGTGEFGARVAVANGPPVRGSILLQSQLRRFEAGAVCHAQLWARASGKNASISIEFVAAANGANTTATRVLASQDLHLLQGHYCLHLLGPVRVAAAGLHGMQLDLGGARAGAVVDVDDIEVYCTL